MPRIDPISGVEVMTTAEFFNEEAQREGRGRSGGDLLSEMMIELGQEEEKDRQICQNDWTGNLSTFQECAINNTEYWLREIYDWDSCSPSYREEWINPRTEIPPYPVELKSMNVVKFRESMRETNILIEFVALCDDGQTRSGEYGYYHCSGTFFDPPEIDESIEWIEVKSSEIE